VRSCFWTTPKVKKQTFATAAAVLISSTALLVLLCLLGRTDPGVPSPALAALLQITPTVLLVNPTSAPNDLDTAIVITGTDFVSTPTVYLGDTLLDDLSWVSSTTLAATVPWGIDPGVYTVTVSNPGSESGSLSNAFTVTQGIGVWNAGELYGGNIGEVVVNPVTPTTVYAASQDVGLFRSRDGGESWSLVYAPGASDLAIDPITPTTIYWGSGGQLYRSDDEGDTWNHLISISPADVPYPHPTISGTVYATRQWDGGGLWKSTDRGQTWVTATNGLTDTNVSGLVFHPTDPITMYLGTANGNVFRSTDAGDSWIYVAQPINYVITLAINPRGAHELWVSNGCLNVPGITRKSTNVEHTAWISVGQPVGTVPLQSIDFPPLAWGDAFSRTVFVAGCFNDGYKTTNDGDTWEHFCPEGGEIGHDIALHPAISNTFYASSKYDGVYKTVDGGETFQVINQGLTAVVPEQLAAVPGQPDVVYAITDRPGGIYKATRGGENWRFLDIDSAGDRTLSVVSVDPFTPTRVYAAGDHPAGFSWWIHTSEDGGETWTMTAVITAAEPYSDCNAVMIGVLRADPVHPGILLAGIHHLRFGTPYFEAGGIYSSTDYGENWTYIDVGQEISPVTDLAYDAVTPTIVYAATDGGGMLRSTDGGQTWQRTGESEPSLDSVESIAVEQSSPYRVFVWTGPGGAGLYVSEDHGESWAQADFALTGFQVEQILCTHDDPSSLYLAVTSGWLGPGLFRSTDGAQSWWGWGRAAGALGYVPIYSLATVTATDRVILYAGTTGGYVGGGTAQALDSADNGGTLVNAGVYRYTMRLAWEVYLPLVFKAYTP
jgi:photosystem II stability/assembly factor-like uncharacterized protein